jgi:selenide, water dikinase
VGILVAGVFAVRAGPYLFENIGRFLRGYHSDQLRHHRPQMEFLGLISTGDKYAIATKGPWLALEGSWIWHWKDWIDRTWMAKYSTGLPDMEEAWRQTSKRRRVGEWGGSNIPLEHWNYLQKWKGSEAFEALLADPMRCGGCGAKVGATTVSKVLKSVYQRQLHRATELKYDTPTPIEHDDASVLPLAKLLPASSPVGNVSLIQTIDYFREIVSDPFMFGKIVAIHALSDVHAMGATPQTAMALIVAPFAADEAMTENVLVQLLSGVSDVLQDENVQLVGGHTCEGLELACGLSLQGFADSRDGPILRKRGGRVGDSIVLTKPLGTGALFAADMRAKASGACVDQAISSMLQSNGIASRFAQRATGVRACTDVTGFGLMGHLLEMIMANEGADDEDKIGATLSITDIPLLEGGIEASRLGIFSSLQAQNFRSHRAVCNHDEALEKYPVEYPLLYDPQTAGGLLFFVDTDHCGSFVEGLRRLQVPACVIGEVESQRSYWPELVIKGEAQDVNTINGTSNTGLRMRIK